MPAIPSGAVPVDQDREAGVAFLFPGRAALRACRFEISRMVPLGSDSDLVEDLVECPHQKFAAGFDVTKARLLPASLPVAMAPSRSRGRFAAIAR